VPRRLLACLLLGLVLGLLVAGPVGLSAPAGLSSPAVRLAGAVAPTVPSATTGWQAPLPLPLAVVRLFAPPPTRYAAGHRGVDLAAPPGATVTAAGAGTVAFAGVLAGRGVVSVRHADGLRTTYEPLTGLRVHRGTAVAAGAPLGLLATGHAGCPTSACLHWGLISDGTLRPPGYLDPLLLLGRGPPRLLPLDPLVLPELRR